MVSREEALVEFSELSDTGESDSRIKGRESSILEWIEQSETVKRDRLTLRDLQIVRYENAHLVASLPPPTTANANISPHISEGKGLDGLLKGMSGSRRSLPGR